MRLVGKSLVRDGVRVANLSRERDGTWVVVARNRVLRGRSLSSLLGTLAESGGKESTGDDRDSFPAAHHESTGACLVA